MTLEGAPFRAGPNGRHLTIAPKTMALLVPSSSRMQAELMSILSGLHSAPNGQVTVDGVDVSSVDLPVARRLVGAVLSDPFIHTGTVADNIISGMTGVSDDYVIEVAKLAGVVPYSANPIHVLEGSVTEAGENLAIGFRRRLGLARVLLRNPAVIVAEAPSHGLGTAEAARTLNALRAVSHRHTLLVVSAEGDMAERASRVFSFVPPDRTAHLMPPAPWATPDDRPSDAAPTATATAAASAAATATPHQLSDPAAGSVAPGPAHTSGSPPSPQPAHNPGPAPSPQPAHNPGPAANRRSSNILEASAPTWRRHPGPEAPASYTLAGLHHRHQSVDVWLAWSAEHQQLVRLLMDRASASPSPTTSDDTDCQLSLAYQRSRSFSHAALPRVMDNRMDDDHRYLVLNFFGHTTLEQHFARRRANMSPVEVMSLGSQLADALDHMHQNGYCLGVLTPQLVVHRDGRVQVESTAGALPVGAAMPVPGSPAAQRFTAPEGSGSQPATPAMDIFALGRVLQAGLQSAVGSLDLRDSPSSGSNPTEVPHAEHHPDTPRHDRSASRREIHTFVSQLTSEDPHDRPTAAEAVAAMATLAGFTPEKPGPATPRRISQDLALSQ